MTQIRVHARRESARSDMHADYTCDVQPSSLHVKPPTDSRSPSASIMSLEACSGHYSSTETSCDFPMQRGVLLCRC